MDRRSVTRRLLATLVPHALKRTVQELVFSQLALEWTLASGVRVEILSPSDWALYNDIFVDAEYDPAMYLFLKRLAADEPALVVNLGANVGFFGKRLFPLCIRAGIAPQQIFLFSVEPNETNIREFQ